MKQQNQNNKAVKPIWNLNPQKGQLTFLKSPDEASSSPMESRPIDRPHRIH
ncbi:hypothetical protein R3W88_020042 [Solanum pinnatisectum]|uniref:Uncharacterized protein n=1 Tax=Solanum pinnatisectum TaxID=50273 RepID=A0AAV9KNA2_9SOLN|nr:hypothetical protein R3W88_020042 [Solanum pinnatisectum]